MYEPSNWADINNYFLSAGENVEMSLGMLGDEDTYHTFNIPDNIKSIRVIGDLSKEYNLSCTASDRLDPLTFIIENLKLRIDQDIPVIDIIKNKENNIFKFVGENYIINDSINYSNSAGISVLNGKIIVHSDNNQDKLYVRGGAYSSAIGVGAIENTISSSIMNVSTDISIEGNGTIYSDGSPNAAIIGFGCIMNLETGTIKVADSKININGNIVARTLYKSTIIGFGQVYNEKSGTIELSLEVNAYGNANINVTVTSENPNFTGLYSQKNVIVGCGEFINVDTGIIIARKIVINIMDNSSIYVNVLDETKTKSNVIFGFGDLIDYDGLNEVELFQVNIEDDSVVSIVANNDVVVFGYRNADNYSQIKQSIYSFIVRVTDNSTLNIEGSDLVNYGYSEYGNNTDTSCNFIFSMSGNSFVNNSGEFARDDVDVKLSIDGGQLQSDNLNGVDPGNIVFTNGYISVKDKDYNNNLFTENYFEIKFIYNDNSIYSGDVFIKSNEKSSAMIKLVNNNGEVKFYLPTNDTLVYELFVSELNEAVKTITYKDKGKSIIVLNTKRIEIYNKSIVVRGIDIFRY